MHCDVKESLKPVKQKLSEFAREVGLLDNLRAHYENQNPKIARKLEDCVCRAKLRIADVQKFIDEQALSLEYGLFNQDDQTDCTNFLSQVEAEIRNLDEYKHYLQRLSSSPEVVLGYPEQVFITKDEIWIFLLEVESG